MDRSLTAHPAVPDTNAAGARPSVSSLGEYPHAAATVVHAVRRIGGAPDGLSIERAAEVAGKPSAAFREIMPDHGTERLDHEDVVGGIDDPTVPMDVSANAFRSHGGSRPVQLLAGDESPGPATGTDLPVVAPIDTDAEGG